METSFESILPRVSQLSALFDNMYEGVYFVDTDRKILFWSKGAERISGYSVGEVSGFHCFDNILIHTDNYGKNMCVSGCPLLGSMKDGKECESNAYMHHKNGSRVPVKMHIIPVKNEEGHVLGAFELFTENLPKGDLSERLMRLQKEALLDSLTELGNRRYFEANLYGRLKQQERNELPFAMLFLDIDKFKTVNDNFGHDVGDRVLVMIARTLQSNVRPFDLVSRLGGDEFTVLMDKIDPGHLFERAEKLRLLVEKSEIFAEGRTISVTVSVGATLSLPLDTAASIMKRADGLMYKAKNGGRNEVVVG